MLRHPREPHVTATPALLKFQSQDDHTISLSLSIYTDDIAILHTTYILHTVHGDLDYDGKVIYSIDEYQKIIVQVSMHHQYFKRSISTKISGMFLIEILSLS